MAFDLAATAVRQFIVPLLKNGIDKLKGELSKKVDEVSADHAAKVAEKVWERVQTAFPSTDDTTIKDATEYPEQYEAVLQAKLEKKLAADPALAEELKALVTSTDPAGTSSAYQIMGNAGIVNISGGTVTGIVSGYTEGSLQQSDQAKGDAQGTPKPE